MHSVHASINKDWWFHRCSWFGPYCRPYSIQWKNSTLDKWTWLKCIAGHKSNCCQLSQEHAGLLFKAQPPSVAMPLAARKLWPISFLHRWVCHQPIAANPETNCGVFEIKVKFSYTWTRTLHCVSATNVSMKLKSSSFGCIFSVLVTFYLFFLTHGVTVLLSTCRGTMRTQGWTDIRFKHGKHGPFMLADKCIRCVLLTRLQSFLPSKMTERLFPALLLLPKRNPLT